MIIRLNGDCFDENEERKVQEDISDVCKRSAELCSILEGSVDDKEIGIEIIHAWVLDVLGMTDSSGYSLTPEVVVS